MKTSVPAEHSQANDSRQLAGFQTASTAAFNDARPSQLAQLQQQATMHKSPRSLALQSMVQLVSSRSPASAVHSNPNRGVLQLVQKTGPDDQGMIEVDEVEDYVPNCVDNGEISRKFYRRSEGITSGWNDQDLFYADGEEGALVQITVAMVNDYWDPGYDGFAKLSGPDWIKNCEDYAKTDGFGEELGDYTDTETLTSLIAVDGSYVLKLSFHWMRVVKTGADALTIRQKDGESAVYSRDFNLQNGLAYILAKREAGGTVYNG